jgi:ABC-type thiamin/hydroxymethylpyrimidine transport system permease subunit
MPGMEPEAKDFLKRIVWSISTGLLYLLINTTAGIMFGLLFFDHKPGIGNYLFYAWFIASTAGLLLLLRKWWRKKFPHG